MYSKPGVYFIRQLKKDQALTVQFKAEFSVGTDYCCSEPQSNLCGPGKFLKARYSRTQETVSC